MDAEEIEKLVKTTVAETVENSLKEGLAPITQTIMSEVDKKIGAAKPDDALEKLVQAINPQEKEKNPIEVLAELGDDPADGQTIANALTYALNQSSKVAVDAIKASHEQTTEERQKLAINASPNYRQLLDNKKYQKIRGDQFDPRFNMSIEEMETKAAASGDPDEMERFAELMHEHMGIEAPTETPRGRANGSSVGGETGTVDQDSERAGLEQKLLDLEKQARDLITGEDRDDTPEGRAHRKEVLDEITRIDNELNGGQLGQVA